MSHNTLHQTTSHPSLSASCNLQENPCKTPGAGAAAPSPRPWNVLVIDGQSPSLNFALETLGQQVTSAADPATALALAGQRPFEVAFLDVASGRKSLELIPKLLRAAPGLTLIALAPVASGRQAIEAVQQGAFDYLIKPAMIDELHGLLAKVGQHRWLLGHVDALEDQVRWVVPEADLRTEDATMSRELDNALRAAASDVAILIRGESGTGKRALARRIHACSPQAHGPFVTIHCPNLPADLLESELFGHVEGALAGALHDAPGKVQSANGGVLFLDEIGALPNRLQPKVLRLLQERRYERVGESITRLANVRILAATRRDLEADVAQGRFRQDLLQRLSVICVTCLPLRKRTADILPLARHLLAFFARESGKPISAFSPEAEAALLAFDWPGNVRELRNAVERAVILATGSTIGRDDLPTHVASGPPTRSKSGIA